MDKPAGKLRHLGIASADPWKYRDADNLIFEVTAEDFATEPSAAAKVNTGGGPRVKA